MNTIALHRTTNRVGKKDLCVTLGWSRARLDRRIEADPALPVVQRGTQAGGWLFDPDAVLAHLAMVPTIRRPGRPRRKTREDQAGSARSVEAQLTHIRVLGKTIEKSIQELRDAMDDLEELTRSETLSARPTL